MSKQNGIIHFSVTCDWIRSLLNLTAKFGPEAIGGCSVTGMQAPLCSLKESTSTQKPGRYGHEEKPAHGFCISVSWEFYSTAFRSHLPSIPPSVVMEMQAPLCSLKEDTSTQKPGRYGHEDFLQPLQTGVPESFAIRATLPERA